MADFPAGMSVPKLTPLVHVVAVTGTVFAVPPAGVTIMAVGAAKPVVQAVDFLMVAVVSGAWLVLVIVARQVTLPPLVTVSAVVRVKATLALGTSSLYIAVMSSLPSKVVLYVGVVLVVKVLGFVLPLYQPLNL